MSPETVKVRDAAPADWPEILRIYNDAIETSTATFDMERMTLDERRGWFEQFGPARPLLVAELEGAIAGYAYYAPFRDRAGFDRTQETSIYIDPRFHRRGVGSALYARLIQRARESGVHVLVAVLGGRNEASVALHRKFGFERSGRLREVGFKFGQLHDIDFYQMILD